MNKCIDSIIKKENIDEIIKKWSFITSTFPCVKIYIKLDENNEIKSYKTDIGKGSHRNKGYDDHYNKQYRKKLYDDAIKYDLVIMGYYDCIEKLFYPLMEVELTDITYLQYRKSIKKMKKMFYEECYKNKNNFILNIEELDKTNYTLFEQEDDIYKNKFNFKEFYNLIKESYIKTNEDSKDIFITNDIKSYLLNNSKKELKNEEEIIAYLFKTVNKFRVYDFLNIYIETKEKEIIPYFDVTNLESLDKSTLIKIGYHDRIIKVIENK